MTQPPPRGCVLKQGWTDTHFWERLQPPPRGCVLKQSIVPWRFVTNKAAASARLCVETSKISSASHFQKQPPPRGCVLKPALKLAGRYQLERSRLRAAVC